MQLEWLQRSLLRSLLPLSQQRGLSRGHPSHFVRPILVVLGAVFKSFMQVWMVIQKCWPALHPGWMVPFNAPPVKPAHKQGHHPQLGLHLLLRRHPARKGRSSRNRGFLIADSQFSRSPVPFFPQAPVRVVGASAQRAASSRGQQKAPSRSRRYSQFLHRLSSGVGISPIPFLSLSQVLCGRILRLSPLWRSACQFQQERLQAESVATRDVPKVDHKESRR